LIAYFIGNVFAKITKIRSCMPKLYQAKGGTFFETRCISMSHVFSTLLTFLLSFERFLHLCLVVASVYNASLAASAITLIRVSAAAAAVGMVMSC